MTKLFNFEYEYYCFYLLFYTIIRISDPFQLSYNIISVSVEILGANRIQIISFIIKITVLPGQDLSFGGVISNSVRFNGKYSYNLHVCFYAFYLID